MFSNFAVAMLFCHSSLSQDYFMFFLLFSSFLPFLLSPFYLQFIQQQRLKCLLCARHFSKHEEK